MLEIARYEIERRLRGTLILGLLTAVFAAFVLAFFPSVQDSSAALEEYAGNLPPAFRAMFGLDSFSTIGGFLATELYQFVWLLMLGFYLAYRASSLVAADVETGRIDLVLAAPVSRTRILFERYVSLLPAMIVVNLTVLPVVYGGTLLIGTSIGLDRLIVVHLLSIPYFLASAGIGLVLSVLTASESMANRAALVGVFALWLVESMASLTDFGVVGVLAPTRYYDPTAILTRGIYDVQGALVLLVGTGLLLLVARALFRRADIT